MFEAKKKSTEVINLFIFDTYITDHVSGLLGLLYWYVFMIQLVASGFALIPIDFVQFLE